MLSRKMEHYILPDKNPIIKHWKILKVIFDKGGESPSPSVSDIARGIKKPRNTVNRAIIELEDWNIIETEKRGGFKLCKLTDIGKEIVFYFRKKQPLKEIIESLREKKKREPFIEEIAERRGIYPKDRTFLNWLYKIAPLVKYRPEWIPHGTKSPDLMVGGYCPEEKKQTY